MENTTTFCKRVNYRFVTKTGIVKASFKNKMDKGVLGKKLNESENGQVIYKDQLITIGDLESFKIALLEEIKIILRGPTRQPTKQWLKSTEVRKMLGISPGTLQNLRVNGTLPFTKVGGIVFYRYDDIARLLNSRPSK